MITRCFLSTHTLSEVTATCDRVIIISAGRIVADDTLKALADKHAGGNPDMLEKIFLSLTEA